jgi:hypothetical protein
MPQRFYAEIYTFQMRTQFNRLQVRHTTVNAFFRIGYIESWGRRMDKMKNQCIAAKLPAPIISIVTQYRLGNLWGIMDYNRLQGFGYV